MNTRDTSTCYANVLISKEYETKIKPLFKEGLDQLNLLQSFNNTDNKQYKEKDNSFRVWMKHLHDTIFKFLKMTVKDDSDHFQFSYKAQFIHDYLGSINNNPNRLYIYKDKMDTLELQLSRFIEDVKQDNDEAIIKRTTIDYTAPLLNINAHLSSIDESMKILAVYIKQLSQEQKVIDPSKSESSSKKTEATISGLFGNRK